MATLASLRILLGLDASGVRTGARQARAELSGLDRAMSDLRRGFAAGLGIGGGLGAFSLARDAVREFTDLLGDSVKAALAEEAGIRRLDQSLKANITGWDGNREAIERTIAARQALGFADDEQRDSLARVVAATGDVNAALAIQATAMDLARFKGISLADATDALIRVESGQFRALKALGIELRTGATQTEALAAVQKVAAGQAEEFGQTTAGALAAAGVEIDNLKEDFGALAAGPVKDLAVAVRTDLIPVLRDAIEFFKQLGQFGDAHDFVPFIGQVADLTNQAKEMRTELEALRNRPPLIALEETLRAELLNDALTDLQSQFAAGAISEDEYRAASDALTGSIAVLLAELNASGRAWATHEQGATEAAAATADAAKAAKDAEDATRGLADATSDIIGPLNEAERAALGVGAAFGAIGGSAASASTDIRNLTADMVSLNERIAARGDTPVDTANAQFTLDNAERDRQIAEDRARERERAAEEAARRREQAASEASRRAEQRANDAARQAEQDAREEQRAREDMWRAAEQAANRYFDRVHRENLDAIDDIRDRRDAELDAQNAAIQGFVDAERARIAEIRNREHEAELRAAVAGAETPEDLASAQRDLQRFLTDERLDFLQAQADAQIAQNEVARSNAQAAADLAIAAENLRDATARMRFDPRVRMNAEGTEASVSIADFVSQPIVIEQHIYIDGQQISYTTEQHRAVTNAVINPKPPSASGQV